MKRTLSLTAVLLVFAVMLAACGGSGSSGNGETQSASAESGTSTNAGSTGEKNEETAASGEPFVIRLGSWFIDDRQHMTDFKANVEKAFKEKYPNGTIQWDILLSATYMDKLKAELASETAPDVFFHQNTLGQYAEAGYLMDLSGEPWAGKLRPGSKIATHYKGKVYGASMALNAVGVWYNKKIFSDLGLSVPKTWAEFIDMAEKIKAGGITPIALGFKDLWTANLFLELVVQSIGYESSPTYGKDLYDGTKKLNGEEMQSAMRKFEDMTKREFFNKTALSLDWPQSAELFSSGKAAMIVQGPWMPGVAADNFAKYGFEAFEVGYMPIPTESGYYNLNISAGESLSINVNTKHQQAAKDLVSIIVSPEVLGPFSEGNGSIPALDGVEATYPTPALNEMLAAVNNGQTSPGYSSFIPVSAATVTQETVTKIVSGVNFNPNDLKEAQNKLEKDKGTVILPPE
ncbi:ABC transporter substrate-binding protein [Cohnella silvisoli]|uniref:Extracellular solute-binding protein n=1 Tax=Cohnella silvisoli TaxID=2873699 RepID=A0ABV1L5K1_9BACL|nr:extracellular solute-binding protein [Cohnella silvisoli]MCD9026413.1 extracellular solute-binding protein [Cohnella silvisoli]